MTKVMNVIKTGGWILFSSVITLIEVSCPLAAILAGFFVWIEMDIVPIGISSIICGVIAYWRIFSPLWNKND